MEILFYSFIAIIIIINLILYRINWINFHKHAIIQNDLFSPTHKYLEEYNKLPSEIIMVFKFWIWNIDKFKKEKQNEI